MEHRGAHKVEKFKYVRHSVRHTVSNLGRKGPDCQETQVELSAKMGPYRALPADPIGTMWTGDPSTVLVNTMLERAVEVSDD